MSYYRLILPISFLLVLSFGWLFSAVSIAQQDDWEKPVPISGALRGARFPSIADTPDKAVHVTWNVKTEDETELVFYTRLEDRAWSRPVDVIVGGSRPVIAVDGYQVAHLFFLRGTGLGYSQAAGPNATTPTGWSQVFSLYDGEDIHGADIDLDDKGNLHLVFTAPSGTCDECYRVLYRESVDRGEDWTEPNEVIADLTQRSSTRVGTDPAGTIWIVREIVFSDGGPFAVGIVSSRDGGQTWTAELPFRSGDTPFKQGVVASDGKGTVLLVARAVGKEEVFHAISRDDGETWEEPKPIPRFIQPRVSTPNDKYDLAVDSAGRFHLIGGGRTTRTQESFALYHLEWDGTTWSSPEPIYEGVGFAEAPSLQITGGNRLNVAFVIRDPSELEADARDPDAALRTSQVWYTTRTVDAPATTAVPLPTFTPTADATATAAALPTETPVPTKTPLPPPTPSPQLFMNPEDPQFPMILALGAVAAVLIVLIVLRVIYRRIGR